MTKIVKEIGSLAILGTCRSTHMRVTGKCFLFANHGAVFTSNLLSWSCVKYVAYASGRQCLNMFPPENPLPTGFEVNSTPVVLLDFDHANSLSLLDTYATTPIGDMNSRRL